MDKSSVFQPVTLHEYLAVITSGINQEVNDHNEMTLSALIYQQVSACSWLWMAGPFLKQNYRQREIATADGGSGKCVPCGAYIWRRKRQEGFVMWDQPEVLPFPALRYSVE
ncbi:unnamed protein product [Arctogadus glacialis]